VAAGAGSLPDASPLDIALDGVPVWAVAAPSDAGLLWVVVLRDGRIQAFLVSGGGATPVAVQPAQVPAGMPLLLKADSAGLTVLTAPDGSASPFNHPVEVGGRGSTAWIGRGSDLLLRSGGQTRRLELAALPDARILSDSSGRLLLLTGATDRYGHGVLGDSIKAGAVTLVESGPEPSVVFTISIPDPAVVEGISPICADLTGDGRREVIVTVSDASDGARLVVFDEDGRRIAAGPPIGRGLRWRHQIAVAPFGPGGETEIAAVMTPHIGGVAEFYRLEGAELRIVARVGDVGFTSHALGSRNLDMAAAGDFDGDGRVELLVPDRAMESLVAVRRTADGAEVAWSVPVGGRLTTNIAAVTLPDGSMAVGVGWDDGTLRVWLPIP
jgi:hypothetical protein